MNLQIEINGHLRLLELTPAGADSYDVVLDGKKLDVDARLLQPGILSLLIEGRSYRCVLERTGGESAVYTGGERWVYRVDDPRSLKSRRRHAGDANGPKTLKAPMPGRVLRVLVKLGDQVEEHQGIVVIEAMKMQNELKSPKAGTVTELRVEPGGTVGVGDVLAVID